MQHDMNMILLSLHVFGSHDVICGADVVNAGSIFILLHGYDGYLEGSIKRYSTLLSLQPRPSINSNLYIFKVKPLL